MLDSQQGKQTQNSFNAEIVQNTKNKTGQCWSQEYKTRNLGKDTKIRSTLHCRHGDRQGESIKVGINQE